MDNVKRYRFFHDPGHGWLEVPVEELKALEILPHITGYSYISRDGHTAYLEEDCDITTFHNARATAGLKDYEYDSIYQDPTFIRGLPNFQVPENMLVRPPEEIKRVFNLWNELQKR